MEETGNEFLKGIVKEYVDADDDSENLENLRKDIFCSFNRIHGESSLVNIVDSLSFALTDINVGIRAKGTGLLAEFIHQCLPGSMDSLEVDTLVRFCCDRIKDHHTIQPIVIYAFLGLISYQNMKDELIIMALQSIFAEVHIQSLVQADRRNVFNIFSNLLKSKTHVLKSFSSDFVLGFIQAMDSERDPRNLLICFDNSLLVIRELDFNLFTEDLFEVLSCYFPVEFTPPKEDEFRIKKEDLVYSLRKCLTSTKLFAPFSIPLYLEKLSSEIIDSKLDSLLTFTECLKIYNPKDVALFINDIWLAVRKDYLLSNYVELQLPYLDFVYRLVACLSQLGDKEPLLKMVDFLIKDCLQTLKDPEMTIAIPCGNVILHASNASHEVFQEIVKKVISPLKVSLEKYTSPLQRTSILEIIMRLLSVDNENIKPNNILLEFVDYLLPLLYTLVSNCEDIALQVLSLKCLENVIVKSSWFETCDFDILAHHCFCPVQQNVLSSELLNAYKSFTRVTAEKFPLIFKKQFLEVLEIKIVGREERIALQCLNLLECSCQGDELTQDVYKYFSRFITIISNTSEEYENVLTSYITILKKSEANIDGKLFILPLIKLLPTVNQSDDLLLKISYSLSESFKQLPITQKNEVFVFVCNVLTNNYDANSSLFGIPIKLDLDNKMVYFCILLRGVFTQLRTSDWGEGDGMCDRLYAVSTQLIQVMEKNDDLAILEHLGIALGSVINKVPVDSAMTKEYLHLISDRLHVEKPHPYAIVLLSWLTKALVLNWQSSTTTAIDLMLASLNKETIGDLAATGFGIIVQDMVDAFTNESNFTIKLMHKQRYTQYVLPLLINNYHDGKEGVKSYHMIAISKTLPAIPRQMLQKHLKSLMPLLMHSLATCDTTPITESTLTTILSVLAQNKEVIMDYVSSLVPRLLNLVSHDNMDIRILCLKSLAVLSSYTSHLVQPMKKDVIRKVQVVLDDKKRLVRMEATRCSNAWYLMSSATV